MKAAVRHLPFLRPPRRQPLADARLGFTLIELMVVVVLIGIMTAAILPEMRGTYQDALLRSTSRKLISVFHLAASQAVLLNEPHRVRLDSKNHRYFIEKMDRAGEAEHGSLVRRGVPGSQGDLDPRLSLQLRQDAQDPESDAGEDETFAAPATESLAPPRDEWVTFYPDGTADAGEIVLRDGDGFGLALRINPVTARVHVVALERE